MSFPIVNSNKNITGCLEGLDHRYNSTLEQYQTFVPFVVHFARVSLPIWLLIGVPGGIMSLVVWSSKAMRSSSSIYLCALAALDVAFLLCQQLPYHIHMYYNIKVMYIPLLCQASPVYNMWLQYLSPLLTLGFTIERYISICHPFSRERLCTIKGAVIVVSCMTVFCLALGLVQLYFYKYDYEHQCCSEDERIFDSSSFQHRFYSGWTKVTEVMFFALVPLAILVFNVLVLVQARRVIRSQASAGQEERASKASATTATLLTVSFYQIGAVLPVTVLLFVGHAILTEDPQLPCDLPDSEAKLQMAQGHWPVVRSYLTYLTVSRTVDCLAVSHYAMKFVIYLVTGRRFRRELVAMCSNCGGWKSSTGGTLDHQHKQQKSSSSAVKATSEQRRLRRERRPLRFETAQNGLDDAVEYC